MPVYLHSPCPRPRAQLVLFHSLILKEAAFSRKNSNAQSLSDLRFRRMQGRMSLLRFPDPGIRSGPPTATLDLALDPTEVTELQ